MVFLQSYTV